VLRLENIGETLGKLEKALGTMGVHHPPLEKNMMGNMVDDETNTEII